MYSLQVSLILIAMITTGVVRSVGIKLFYQMGFEDPFFVTLMFHLSGVPSFAFYGLYRCVKLWRTRKQTTDTDSQRQTEKTEAAKEANDADQPEEQSGITRSVLEDSKTNDPSRQRVRIEDSSVAHSEFSGANGNSSTSYHAMGSQTGLTEEPHATAASLLHHLPWYGKLFLLGLFNFLSYIMRWSAILLMRTSVAEMLLNGVELVLAALGSRLIRKRYVSRARWAGVSIVTVGLVIIGVADVLSTSETNGISSDKDDSSSSLSRPVKSAIGICLILGVGCFATLLAMAEEILTQEGRWSVFLIIGHEGLWSFVIGLLVYFMVEPVLNEKILDTWNLLTASKSKTCYMVGLLLVCTAANLANVFAVAVTSSMTRNIWQHLRSFPVWIVGLIMYYSVESDDGGEVGESWQVPHSIIILLGFLVMISGLQMYYHNHPSNRDQTRELSVHSSAVV